MCVFVLWLRVSLSSMQFYWRGRLTDANRLLWSGQRSAEDFTFCVMTLVACLALICGFVSCVVVAARLSLVLCFGAAGRMDNSNHHFHLSIAMRMFSFCCDPHSRVCVCVCVSWFGGFVVVCVSFSSVQFGGWGRMTELNSLFCSELRYAHVFYLVT